MRIKREFLIWVGASAALMLLLPWLLTSLVTPTAVMVLAILCLFAVDPLFAAVVGVVAGRDVRQRWSLPLFNLAFFVLGAWLSFAEWETDLLVYALIYLCISGLSLLVTVLTIKQRQAEASSTEGSSEEETFAEGSFAEGSFAEELSMETSSTEKLSTKAFSMKMPSTEEPSTEASAMEKPS